MKERGIWARVRNTAKGGTGLWNHWNGNDGSISLIHTDGSWDTNSHHANTLAQLTARSGYDEKWVFISTGQADSQVAAVAADPDVQQGLLEAATNYYLANNIKVAIGLSSYTPDETGTAYATSLKPGLTAALATYSGNSNVIAGADLYSSFGEGVELYDTAHMNSKWVERAADVWYDALVAGGW